MYVLVCVSVKHSRAFKLFAQPVLMDITYNHTIFIRYVRIIATNKCKQINKLFHMGKWRIWFWKLFVFPHMTVSLSVRMCVCSLETRMTLRNQSQLILGHVRRSNCRNSIKTQAERSWSDFIGFVYVLYF